MRTGLEHRWSVANNYLAGITARDWLRLLRENRFSVDPPYWHRAAFITLASILNSLQALRDRRFEAAVDAVEIPEAPLFVLGHWRSGTTHLHNLLAQHTERVGYPTTYQVLNPRSFLSRGRIESSLFVRLLPEKRPMDRMKVGLDTPQEDEFATCLTTLRSLYLGMSFPRREEDYRRYLTFDDDPAALRVWKEAFVQFLKKVTYRVGKPLVLKSPPHTARIRHILELFPDARFVFVHRHPYDVFQSFRHYFDTAIWYTYLQRPDRDTVDDLVIRLYRTLHEAYFRDRHLVPAGQLAEVRFEDLEADPVGQIRRVYDELSLDGFPSLEPTLSAYCRSIADYQRNRFPELDVSRKERIAREWSSGFRAWGYVA